MKNKLIMLVIPILMMGACTQTSPYYPNTSRSTEGPISVSCRESSQEFFTAFFPLQDEWNHVKDGMFANPTIENIDVGIPNLQSIRQKIADLPIPECAQKVKTYELMAMDYSIKGWQRAAAGESMTIVNQLFTQSNDYWRVVATEVSNIK